MRKNLLFACILFASNFVYGQIMTVSDFVKVSCLPQEKRTGYLAKQGFFRTNDSMAGDTIIENFQLNEKFAGKDCAVRHAEALSFNNKTAFSYSTSSIEEYAKIIKDLKADGFYTEGENSIAASLYQKNDLTVKFNTHVDDTLLYYNFLIKKDILPAPKNIAFAEDFLEFQSHENLQYVFGKGSVQKDIYYFSDSDMVRCSVLFPNTNRQIIFIWKDELNRCSLSHILVGNSLRGKKSSGDDRAIGENVWTLRNGLRANMSLTELVRMNNNDLNFYGWNSKYAGIVVPDKKGNIDFKNTGVILSCFNCNGSELMSHDVVSADEAIENSKRIFVLAFILVPQQTNTWTAFR